MFMSCSHRANKKVLCQKLSPVWMFYLQSFDSHFVWQSLRDKCSSAQSRTQTHQHTNTHTHTVESFFPEAFFEHSGIYAVNSQQNRKQQESVRAKWRQLRKGWDIKQVRRSRAQDCSDWFRTSPTGWGKNHLGKLTEGSCCEGNRLGKAKVKQSRAMHSWVKKGHLSVHPSELFPCFPSSADR